MGISCYLNVVDDVLTFLFTLNNRRESPVENRMHVFQKSHDIVTQVIRKAFHSSRQLKWLQILTLRQLNQTPGL